MSLEIRPVAAGDAAQWRRLWTAYLEFYGATVAEDVYRTSFARLLSQDPQEFHGRLAVLDGAPVGLVHFVFHRHMWRIEDVCYLQDLYADPEVRGTGIGRALIEAVCEAADAAGCSRVHWRTEASNTVARRLYDRMARLTPFIVYERG